MNDSDLLKKVESFTNLPNDGGNQLHGHGLKSYNNYTMSVVCYLIFAVTSVFVD